MNGAKWDRTPMTAGSGFPHPSSFKDVGDTGGKKDKSGHITVFLPSSLALERPSVDRDGVFPKLQELDEFVPGPLLQSHECSGFLVPILVDVQDDPGPFFCLLIARVSKELLEGLLIQALKNVGHGFLAHGRVEVIAVDRRAHPQRSRHAGQKQVVSLSSQQCQIQTGLPGCVLLRALVEKSQFQPGYLKAIPSKGRKLRLQR